VGQASPLAPKGNGMSKFKTQKIAAYKYVYFLKDSISTVVGYCCGYFFYTYINSKSLVNYVGQVYHAEFVVLCIGQFSGLPNIPEFLPNQGPEVFKGKVMHSEDFSALDNSTAAELIKTKRITIVGSHKTAVDIAAECANANGKKTFCQANIPTLSLLSDYQKDFYSKEQ
jgi:hypothetical protein